MVNAAHWHTVTLPLLGSSGKPLALWAPFYTEGNWSPEGLSDSPKVTLLENYGAGIQTWVLDATSHSLTFKLRHLHIKLRKKYITCLPKEALLF